MNERFKIIAYVNEEDVGFVLRILEGKTEELTYEIERPLDKRSKIGREMLGLPPNPGYQGRSSANKGARLPEMIELKRNMLAMLLDRGPLSKSVIMHELNAPAHRVAAMRNELMAEGAIIIKGLVWIATGKLRPEDVSPNNKLLLTGPKTEEIVETEGEPKKQVHISAEEGEVLRIKIIKLIAVKPMPFKKIVEKCSEWSKNIIGWQGRTLVERGAITRIDGLWALAPKITVPKAIIAAQNHFKVTAKKSAA